MKKVSVLAGFAVLSLVLTQNVQGEDMVVTNGKKVKFDYTLTVDGEQVETSVGKIPLEYTHGENQIIPGLEQQLADLKVGDKKSVSVAPDAGYGKVMDEAIKEIPKTSFPADFVPQVGMVIEMSGPEGQTFPGVIQEIKDTGIMVNFNHPLAGKTLNFDVTIVGIE